MAETSLTKICQALPCNATGDNNAQAASIYLKLTGEIVDFELNESGFSNYTVVFANDSSQDVTIVYYMLDGTSNVVTVAAGTESSQCTNVIAYTIRKSTPGSLYAYPTAQYGWTRMLVSSQDDIGAFAYQYDSGHVNDVITIDNSSLPINSGVSVVIVNNLSETLGVTLYNADGEYEIMSIASGESETTNPIYHAGSVIKCSFESANTILITPSASRVANILEDTGLSMWQIYDLYNNTITLTVSLES